MAKGYLQINVYADNIAQPVKNVEVHITGEDTDITLITDEDGSTETIELNAPDLIYSEEPQEEVQPFSKYEVTTRINGLVDARVEGVEVFPDVTSIQNVYMESSDEVAEDETVITIDPPALWDDTEAKVVENPSEETSTTSPSPFILLTPTAPDYVVVHDGVPTNTSAPNYYIPFIDYIKNVACSEIYSTWPTETIKANVHAIVSFTLNRVYTEWYRSKGYNFTVTSLPAYDQKYTHGRTIFAPISNVVDEYFNQYITIKNNAYPFLAQYNDGINVNNSGWLSQWGSKSLGDQGYTSLQILKYYYGNTTDLKPANISEDYPTSFPGYNLGVGACGEEVQNLQNELNVIHGSYPGIPLIRPADGQYKESTRLSVSTFQKVFSLPVTGIVDFATWYKISYIYVAVTGMLKGVYS